MSEKLRPELIPPVNAGDLEASGYAVLSHCKEYQYMSLLPLKCPGVHLSGKVWCFMLIPLFLPAGFIEL
jgi:hypothetical protein